MMILEFDMINHLEFEDHHQSSVEDSEECWQDPQAMLAQIDDPHLIEALKSLSDSIKWTLLLVDVEGLSHQEAAEIMEVPVGTVKSRAHNGRRMLRDRLVEVARLRGWLGEARGKTI